MLSLLATFFTLIQQREVGVIRDARSFRRWLSNGVQYYNARERLVWQSSLTSLTLVEAPYELISLAVASFVAGMSAYGTLCLYEMHVRHSLTSYLHLCSVGCLEGRTKSSERAGSGRCSSGSVLCCCDRVCIYNVSSVIGTKGPRGECVL
jgi:hypothetical protein